MLLRSTNPRAIEADQASLHDSGPTVLDTRLHGVRLLATALSSTSRRVDDAVLATADRMGLKLADLQVLFPSVAWGRMPAFAAAGVSAR